MANQEALQLIELGFHPVLLGKSGDDLKRPLHKGWQTAVYTPAQVSRWPVGHNVGIRCGLQRNGSFLLIFDFDEEAECIFPAWRNEAVKIVEDDLVIVNSGRGYHIYFYVPDEMGSRTLAGRRVVENGCSRLLKFIETIGRHKQVVSAYSRHPSGAHYRFYSLAGYEEIPTLTVMQLSDLTQMARRFDERPVPIHNLSLPKITRRKIPSEFQNCLDYARCFIGTEERVERNGDVRFLGQGGLLVTADGRGWYSFSEETGGGLTELIVWHRRQVPVAEGASIT